MKEQDILNFDELHQTQKALKQRFDFLTEKLDQAIKFWGFLDISTQDWIQRQQHCAKAYQKIERQMFPYCYK